MEMGLKNRMQRTEQYYWYVATGVPFSTLVFMTNGISVAVESLGRSNNGHNNAGEKHHL